jgi:exonuclease V gamma subunit
MSQQNFKFNPINPDNASKKKPFQNSAFRQASASKSPKAALNFAQPLETAKKPMTLQKNTLAKTFDNKNSNFSKPQLKTGQGQIEKGLLGRIPFNQPKSPLNKS